MIWATVSSQSCFFWFYSAFLSLAEKNIINLILVLTIWWCPCVESFLVLLEEGVCYDQCCLVKTLLVFDGEFWQNEKGMVNHFSILALRTPWTVWKGKKIGTWEMNSLTGDLGEITTERMKRWSQSKNNTQLWMWLVMEVKSDAVKSNIA